MGIGRSTIKSYYDVKPKEILFPEDDDSDLDDLPHDLEHFEGQMSARSSKLHNLCSA